MQRTYLHQKTAQEKLSSGIWLDSLQTGAQNGPNDEVLADVMGGQAWMDYFILGDQRSDFQLMVPDIRMPANQYWPPHWHDCWIGIVVLAGACQVGDWIMGPGDVLISADQVEYGPLLIGPAGCQMFEVFAKAHLPQGGYSPEFEDHPTLRGISGARFEKRSGRNAHNEGRQVIPVGGVDGLIKGHLSAGEQWELGRPADPDRGMLRCTGLTPGERIAPHCYDDWHGIFVLEGNMTLCERELGRHDVIIAEPGCRLEEIRTGREGALWLEVSRVANGMERRPAPG